MDSIRLNIGPLKFLIKSDCTKLIKHIQHVLPHRVQEAHSSYDFCITLTRQDEATLSSASFKMPEKQFFDDHDSVAVDIIQSLSSLENYNKIMKLSTPIMSSLRLIVSYWAGQKMGFLVHSASIIIKQKYGFLAFGKSGSGKSTIANLAPQALGEEWNLIYKEKDRWLVCAPPFRLDALANPGFAQIHACLHLRHAPPVELRDLSTAEAIKTLMAQTSLSFLTNKQRANYSINALRLIDEIPFYEYSFKPDKSAIVFLKKHLVDT